MTLDGRKQTVRDGYDELAPRFGAWTAAVEGDPWQRFLGELAARLLAAAGFELLVDEVVTMREPEGEASFLWALARKAP